MKITIELDLTNDVDKFQYSLITNASELWVSLEDIRQYIRDKIKHHDLSEETEKHLEEVRNLIDFKALENIGE